VLLDRFLDPATPSLKICGVTRADDAVRLADLGVDALGVNFWSRSKRYCPPETAAGFLPSLVGRILRVGVFVNAGPDLPRDLLERGLVDLAQFHGDETPDYCAAFSGRPFLKAIGVGSPADLDRAMEFGARGLLLDAHAPGAYGGTGRSLDWGVAASFVAGHPGFPVVLAGGITPANAAEALATVRPAALDVASGAESAPGLKDFAKVTDLIEALRQGMPGHGE